MWIVREGSDNIGEGSYIHRAKVTPVEDIGDVAFGEIDSIIYWVSLPYFVYDTGETCTKLDGQWRY